MENGQPITPETNAPVAEPTAEQIAFKQQMDYQFMDDVIPAPEASPAIVDPNVPPTTPASEPPKEPNYLAELGFTDIETAKTQIAEWQKLKDAPQAAKEPQYANEESRRVHELLLKGEWKAVKAVYDLQEKLEGVETLSPAEKIKLHIEQANKHYKKADVEDVFEEKYAYPEKPDEDDIDYDTQIIKYNTAKEKIDRRIERDAVTAAEELAKLKSEIKLPDIPADNTDADEDYEGWKASTASNQKFHSEVLVPSITALTEDSLKMSIDVNDANNQMQFGVSITPDKADLEQAKAASSNLLGYIASISYDKDGNFIPNALANLILRNQYFDKYAQSIARQAVNAERVRQVESEKGDAGQRRDISAPVDRTEFQKQMDFALS